MAFPEEDRKDLKLIFKDLEELNKNIKILLTSNVEFSQRLTKIESYLFKDSSTDNDGIVHKVNDHESRISGIEKREEIRDAQSKARIGVYVAFGTGGGIVVGWIVQFLIKKYG